MSLGKSGNETRTERKVRLRDANTSAGEYHAKDVKYQAKKIQAMHSRQKAGIDKQKAKLVKETEQGKKVHAGLKAKILAALPFDVDKALRSMVRKTRMYFGATSKYRPHQGKQECARRLRVGSAAWHNGPKVPF